jgi:transcriptional regulator with GAF, ATPase, and Fis domain
MDEPLVEAVSRILSAALRNVRLVERVAALSLRAHTESQRLRGELERVSPELGMVTASPVMRRLCEELVDVVARQDTTVLLLGESGTGKEVLAKRIHALSPRSGRPMLKVNCGALPDNLIESTLFGHERGAFTGALQRHLGLFERAHGSTLFLDEVAELPLHAQVKLLRVLQEGELERVGGDATVRVSVRIIAATHRPMEEMLEKRTFRSDLYYRLSVFPIQIPPLRDRVEDIPALATTILERLSNRMKRNPPRITAAALRRLESHPWPGNVRELENLIERALVLSPGDVLHLPGELPAPRTSSQPRSVTPVTFDDAERRTLEDALAATRGRIYGAGGAAERLGLKPTTLQSKLRKLRIRRSAFLEKPGP